MKVKLINLNLLTAHTAMHTQQVIYTFLEYLGVNGHPRLQGIICLSDQSVTRNYFAQAKSNYFSGMNPNLGSI